MTLTRDQKTAALNHLLEVVFDQDKDSDLHKAFASNKIRSPHDLITLGESTIDMLQYPESEKVYKLLSPVEIALIKCFRAFLLYKEKTGHPIDDTQWLSLTADEFDKFRISSDYLTIDYSQPTAPSTAMNPVREFKCGIKCDITQFIALKDDAAWDSWNRATIAQARAQDVQEILNSKYKPSNKQEQALFNEKQKYMYAVFEKNLLTDHGKALVHQYQH